MLTHATALLRSAFGLQEFRPLQRQVIAAVLRGNDVLAVLPTGGGKSLCFQVPALHSPGLTLVVSPLIALMQDQVGRLRARGIAAAMLGGPMGHGEWCRILDAATAGRMRLLYLSPERLGRVARALSASRVPITRLVVDEAHCVVDWGHDFRPSYRRIRTARVGLGRPPCVALTATATPLVRASIREALGMAPRTTVIVGSFDRPNLRFEVVRVHGEEDRLARLVVMIRTSRASAVVYAPTRGLVDGLARALRESGVAAAPYHAGMSGEDRRSVLDGFLADRTRVVVATCAFGMGIDKSDVRLVAHWSMPASPEAYYQEAGRAGRDGRPARCVLFHHPNDVAFPRRQLAMTFPDERVVESIWAESRARLRYAEAVVTSADRLEAELHPERGPVDWRPVRRRRRAAEERLKAMAAYAERTGCRRAQLLGWFGESVVRCGGCDRCGR
jgi:ATP-dependent DNA helicase RecQ